MSEETQGGSQGTTRETLDKAFLREAMRRIAIWRMIGRGVRVCFEAVAVLIGTAVLGRWLLALSGTALWLPPEWRHAQLLVPAFGLAFYTFARMTTQWYREGRIRRASAGLVGEARDEAVARAKTTSRLFVIPFAILALATAVVTLSLYSGLTNLCVHKFQPVANLDDEDSDTANDTYCAIAADWWWQHYGDTSAQPPRPRGCCVAHFIEDSEALERFYRTHLDPRIPNFLDRRNGQIYVPLSFPEEVEADLRRRGGGVLSRGIEKTLSDSPAELISWLQVGGAPRLRTTTWLFYWMHVLIIVSVSIASGIMFAPAQSVLKEILEQLAV